MKYLFCGSTLETQPHYLRHYYLLAAVIVYIITQRTPGIWSLSLIMRESHTSAIHDVHVTSYLHAIRVSTCGFMQNERKFMSVALIIGFIRNHYNFPVKWHKYRMFRKRWYPAYRSHPYRILSISYKDRRNNDTTTHLRGPQSVLARRQIPS